MDEYYCYQSIPFLYILSNVGSGGAGAYLLRSLCEVVYTLDRSQVQLRVQHRDKRDTTICALLLTPINPVLLKFLLSGPFFLVKESCPLMPTQQTNVAHRLARNPKGVHPIL